MSADETANDRSAGDADAALSMRRRELVSDLLAELPDVISEACLSAFATTSRLLAPRKPRSRPGAFARASPSAWRSADARAKCGEKRASWVRFRLWAGQAGPRAGQAGPRAGQAGPRLGHATGAAEPGLRLPAAGPELEPEPELELGLGLGLELELELELEPEGAVGEPALALAVDPAEATVGGLALVGAPAKAAHRQVAVRPVVEAAARWAHHARAALVSRGPWC